MTDKELLLEVKNITKSFPGVRAPVSYTHLDVYKRQGLSSPTAQVEYGQHKTVKVS